MTTENNTATLWEMLKKSDDLLAFQKLHAYFYPLLCDFSFIYLRCREASEEVVDDVFVTLWRKKGNLGHVKNIKSYLYTCTRNLSIDYLRKGSRTQEVETGEFKIEKLPYSYEFESDLEMEEFRGHLQEAVDQLPKRCKLIFKMFLNDNLTCGEIAVVLELSKKTVETQVAIAYRKLTAALKTIYSQTA